MTRDERFWARVQKSDGCWEWCAGKGDGYGKIGRSVNGKTTIMGAHRYAYLQTHGHIPPGLYVRHLCHNRACVKPEHLALGTAADNGADTARAGRSRNRWTGRLKAEPVPLEYFRWCAGMPAAEAA